MTELRTRLSVEGIAHVGDADPSRPSTALSLLRVTPNRRSVLRMLGVGALTLGGTVLSWRPRALTRTASAAGVEYAPGGHHSGWLQCMIDYVPDPDSGGRYKGLPAACNNSQNFIASTYCRPSGWHRIDTVRRSTGAIVTYRMVGNRCWGSGTGFATRNAWRWRQPSGNVYRCSDGQMAVTRDGRTHVYNTVCRWKVAG